MDVRFFVFTRANPSQPSEIFEGDLKSVTQSGFSGQKKTVVMLHGWTDYAFLPWLIVRFFQ